MALFVGCLNTRVRAHELEDEFKRYGKLTRCFIMDAPSPYAFVTFSDERDAEDAMEGLQGFRIRGCRLHVKWAKESGRTNPKDSSRDFGYRKRSFDCYSCGVPGHIARDCPNKRRRFDDKSYRSRSRSRSRGPDRYYRSRSRSRGRDDKAYRSRSRGRDDKAYR